MMTITGTSCVRHDTIGGACSKESNTLRYGFHTYAQHACVETRDPSGVEVDQAAEGGGLQHQVQTGRLAEHRPATIADLSGITGIGDKKREAYGEAVLAVIAAAA